MICHKACIHNSQFHISRYPISAGYSNILVKFWVSWVIESYWFTVSLGKPISFNATMFNGSLQRNSWYCIYRPTCWRRSPNLDHIALIVRKNWFHIPRSQPNNATHPLITVISASIRLCNLQTSKRVSEVVSDIIFEISDLNGKYIFQQSYKLPSLIINKTE